jgi:putative thiazole-containing bacteriocin maturation protein
MANLSPSMRLKVKRDTFFLPEANGGVFFRNNVSSFRMEGSGIDKWVEKLLPMFNGEQTLETLTTGLTGPYRDRVYEIAETLYQNGFVKDVSRDCQHQLTQQVLKKYASQIEFIDSFVDSAGFRFQTYREAKVLAVGSGEMFVSLVSSLLESGLPKFQTLIPDRTNRVRIEKLVEHARGTDPEVAVEEITPRTWQEAVEHYDFILYASQEGNVEELRLLHRICREGKKVFIPAFCYQQVGMAGPLVLPESENCWESAWRRLHQDELHNNKNISAIFTTGGAMLSNLIVFELFKHITGVTEREQNHPLYLLDLETMEGNWHSVTPHPLVAGHTSARIVEDVNESFRQDIEKDNVFLFFNKVTSKATGIFHTWSEGDLLQLPLAQCEVQPIDPLSEGPAEVLGSIICSGLTHEEARREAGLAGIEAYGTRLASLLDLSPQCQVGTGGTFAEGVCRGLQKFLEQELNSNQPDALSKVQLNTIEDERCRFYLQALSTMQGTPTIGLGEEVNGFPVVWVGTRTGWYGSVDVNLTLSLRKALQQALLPIQNGNVPETSRGLVVPSMLLEEKSPRNISIPSCDDSNHSVLLRSAMEVLEENGKQLVVFELEAEPFLKEGLAGLFGVLVREGER